MVGGGYQLCLLEAQVCYTNAIVPLIGTIIIFLIVVYAESSRIELPLATCKV